MRAPAGTVGTDGAADGAAVVTTTAAVAVTAPSAGAACATFWQCCCYRTSSFQDFTLLSESQQIQKAKNGRADRALTRVGVRKKVANFVRR